MAMVPYDDDPDLGITPSLLVGVSAALFAGYLSAFACLKKRKLGITVQVRYGVRRCPPSRSWPSPCASLMGAGQAVMVGGMVASWGEALFGGIYEASDWGWALPWALLFYRIVCVSTSVPSLCTPCKSVPFSQPLGPQSTN
jgi:hypothetical protein